MQTTKLEQQIEKAETRVFKTVFPDTTNHYDTLFGGVAMQMMDEVAFMTATRFSRQTMVTVSSDKIDFNKPIPAGTIIEIIGKVKKIGTKSMVVNVEIYTEQMYSNQRELSVNGSFTFVALDKDKKPTAIIKN